MLEFRVITFSNVRQCYINLIIKYIFFLLRTVENSDYWDCFVRRISVLRYVNLLRVSQSSWTLLRVSNKYYSYVHVSVNTPIFLQYIPIAIKFDYKIPNLIPHLKCQFCQFSTQMNKQKNNSESNFLDERTFSSFCLNLMAPKRYEYE
jgi:hypothetical protein